MQKHDAFEIRMHDDDELAGIHGADVAWRKPLRSWPLSIVERVASTMEKAGFTRLAAILRWR
jgi:hypothetical protein